MTMKIILTRHYKTKSNSQKIIMGWSDAPPEDDYYEDLYYVSEVLTSSKFKFKTIWSSDLKRSKVTADIFASLLDASKCKHSSDLNEVDYGSLSKKSKKWVAEHYPKHKKDAEFVYPKGESFVQMQKRSTGFVDQLISKCSADDNVLLVIHAGVIRGLVSHYLNLNYSDNLNKTIGHRYVGVLDITKKGQIKYKELGITSQLMADINS